MLSSHGFRAYLGKIGPRLKSNFEQSLSLNHKTVVISNTLTV
jgi:hypothetical protein